MFPNRLLFLLPMNISMLRLLRSSHMTLLSSHKPNMVEHFSLTPIASWSSIKFHYFSLTPIASWSSIKFHYFSLTPIASWSSINYSTATSWLSLATYSHKHESFSCSLSQTVEHSLTKAEAKLLSSPIPPPSQ